MRLPRLWTLCTLTVFTVAASSSFFNNPLTSALASLPANIFHLRESSIARSTQSKSDATALKPPVARDAVTENTSQSAGDAPQLDPVVRTYCHNKQVLCGETCIKVPGARYSCKKTVTKPKLCTRKVNRLVLCSKKNMCEKKTKKMSTCMRTMKKRKKCPPKKVNYRCRKKVKVKKTCTKKKRTKACQRARDTKCKTGLRKKQYNCKKTVNSVCRKWKRCKKTRKVKKPCKKKVMKKIRVACEVNPKKPDEVLPNRTAPPSMTPFPSNPAQPKPQPSPTGSWQNTQYGPRDMPNPSPTVSTSPVPSQPPLPSLTSQPSEAPLPSATSRPSEDPLPSMTPRPSEEPLPSPTSHPSASPSMVVAIKPVRESPSPSASGKPKPSPQSSSQKGPRACACLNNGLDDTMEECQKAPPSCQMMNDQFDTEKCNNLCCAFCGSASETVMGELMLTDFCAAHNEYVCGLMPSVRQVDFDDGLQTLEQAVLGVDLELATHPDDAEGAEKDDDMQVVSRADNVEEEVGANGEKKCFEKQWEEEDATCEKKESFFDKCPRMVSCKKRVNAKCTRMVKQIVNKPCKGHYQGICRTRIRVKYDCSKVNTVSKRCTKLVKRRGMCNVRTKQKYKCSKIVTEKVPCTNGALNEKRIDKLKTKMCRKEIKEKYPCGIKTIKKNGTCFKKGTKDCKPKYCLKRVCDPPPKGSYY